MVFSGFLRYRVTLRPTTCTTSAPVASARVAAISAASILAKTARDARMAELDKIYPGYGFAAHAGYGTARHVEAIRTLGITPEHRRSFEPVKSMIAGKAAKENEND